MAAIKRKLHTIQALLKKVETRFRSLTTTELCTTAKRAKLTQTELEDVKGNVHRVTVMNILMRRYAFGVFTVLFKQIPMDVFRYICQFFDTDINLQSRISNYVYKETEECRKDHERTKVLRSLAVHDFVLHEEFNEITLYTGIKRCVMIWINKSEHHCTAFYQFHKEQNIKMRHFLEDMREKKEEAKEEVKRTHDRQVYLEKMGRYSMEKDDMEMLISHTISDWFRDYAKENFRESLEMLLENLDLIN